MPSLPPSHPLEVRELRFLRNEEPIFGPLSFALDPREALLVEGGNGVGKTTLLRVLAGLLNPQHGTVHLDGQLADAMSRARQLTYLGHLPGLKADLTCIENLRMYESLQGIREDRSLMAALDKVGLRKHAFSAFRQLSAGQRKRLSLAKVWRSMANVWLLDEPYANLDLQGIDLVNQLIAEHADAGGSVLLTSHGAYASPPVRTRTLSMQGHGQGASA